MRLTLLASVALAAIFFFVPDAWGRVVGLGVEAAFYTIFPRLQDTEFGEWATTHA